VTEPADPREGAPDAATSGGATSGGATSDDATSDDGAMLVDATGLPCPQPVIELARAVKDLAVGGRVRLLADDEAAWVDVPIWCRMQRQRLVSKDRDGRLHTFVVEKVA
jgi:TusA-related sulfurtransferase